jgi:hypothetical protein
VFLVAFALSHVALAQEQPIDLSGLWRRGDGGIVKITQEGQTVRAVHVELIKELREIYGFEPGDDHFIAMLEGRTVRGRMNEHMELQGKSRCPEQWAHWTDTELTVSEDGNTLQGRWKRLTFTGCALQKETWTPIKYTRVQPERGPRLGRLAVQATGDPLAMNQFELILDASGSMQYQHQKIDGRLKIDVAKDVVAEIIRALPEDALVALRVYGHRIREGQPGDCEDSELMVPFRKLDKSRLLKTVQNIRALGTTPIAYSLREVAGDFAEVTGEKMLILVTDGKEECGGNPSGAVSELMAKGLKVRLNVVGFALADADTKREMEKVAQLTGGLFFDARDAAGLRKAIEQSLAVSYDVLDATGKKVDAGVVGGKAIQLPEGTYTAVVRAVGGAITIQDVRIASDKSTQIELKKEGQKITPRILGP